jgi:hypothetical protein
LKWVPLPTARETWRDGIDVRGTSTPRYSIFKSTLVKHVKGEKSTSLRDLPIKISFKYFSTLSGFRVSNDLSLFSISSNSALVKGTRFAATTAASSWVRQFSQPSGPWRAEIVYAADFGVFADVDVNRKRRASKFESIPASSMCHHRQQNVLPLEKRYFCVHFLAWRVLSNPPVLP